MKLPNKFAVKMLHGKTPGPVMRAMPTTVAYLSTDPSPPPMKTRTTFFIGRVLLFAQRHEQLAHPELHAEQTAMHEREPVGVGIA